MLPLFKFARCLVCRRGEFRVPPASPSPPRRHNLLAVFDHIGDDLSASGNTQDRPHRNLESDILAAVSRFPGTESVFPPRGVIDLSVLIVEKRGKMAVCPDDH